jgi:outer membrane protein OmpA-like peptidoglycan-associated protein
MSKPCCWPPQTDSIKPVAEFLNKNKNLTIELGCYSDTRGDAKMNILRTSARAKSVWDYLVFELKVDSTRIKYKGYGENHLIISDKEILQAKTADEKQKLHLINQRTQLTILDIK